MWIQEAEKSSDDYMLGSAKSLIARSSQRHELTTLGGRRDMSMLLAQSAIQVSTLEADMMLQNCKPMRA